MLLFAPPSTSRLVCPLKSQPENWRQHSTERQYVGDHGLVVLTISEPPTFQHQRIVRMYFQ
jgi:hypothetical protein